MINIIDDQKITDSQADAILFYANKDISTEEQTRLKELFPELASTMEKLKADHRWKPGAFAPVKVNNKTFILTCLGDEIAEYSHLSKILGKLRDKYKEYGVKSIASPFLGVGYGLDPTVVEFAFRYTFDESFADAQANPSSLRIDLYPPPERILNN